MVFTTCDVGVDVLMPYLVPEVKIRLAELKFLQVVLTTEVDSQHV